MFPSSPLNTTIVASRTARASFTARAFSLVLMNTDRAGAIFDVPPQGLRLGKAAENDVVIDHPTVSRNHLEILATGERFVVRDLGSTNGTFIDGAQIREAYLAIGSTLELGDVKLRFQNEVAPLEVAPSEEHRLGDLVGRSLPMRQVFALLARIAQSDSTVLLNGETGTGKGAAARALHERSNRREKAFVVFDCASVSHSLIESELFGHERGAFTGAIAQRKGCLERAHGGTLFLDEIDDLSLELQPKLLRALEERVFERLGTSSKPVHFDARVVVASKKDLWSEVQAGRFREDLYFRLSVFSVGLPALRDRREDLPLLVDALGGEGLWARLPLAIREQLQSHTWPGNVRELRNAVERLKHIAEVPALATDLLLPDLLSRAPSGASRGGAPSEALMPDYALPFKDGKDAIVRAYEKEYLRRLLSRCNGNIARAAREAQLDRKHLYTLLEKYGLSSPSSPESSDG